MTTKVFLEDLYESLEIEEPLEFEKKIYNFETQSIRPYVIYTEPLDDASFYALNSPHIRFLAFTAH